MMFEIVGQIVSKNCLNFVIDNCNASAKTFVDARQSVVVKVQNFLSDLDGGSQSSAHNTLNSGKILS